MQIAECLRLHWTAKVKWLLFDAGGQIGHEGVPDFVGSGAIEDQTEGAFGIVLANEDNGAMEERALQLPLIQNELALEAFHVSRTLGNVRQTRAGRNPFPVAANSFAGP